MLLNPVLMVTILDNTFLGFVFQIGVNRNIIGNTYLPQGLWCPWVWKAPRYLVPLSPLFISLLLMLRGSHPNPQISVAHPWEDWLTNTFIPEETC